MIATNFSNVRNNFKEICDRVVHDSDTLMSSPWQKILRQFQVYNKAVF